MQTHVIMQLERLAEVGHYKMNDELAPQRVWEAFYGLTHSMEDDHALVIRRNKCYMPQAFIERPVGVFSLSRDVKWGVINLNRHSPEELVTQPKQCGNGRLFYVDFKNPDWKDNLVRELQEYHTQFNTHYDNDD